MHTNKKRYQNTVNQRKETTEARLQFISLKELLGLFLGYSEQVRPKKLKRDEIEKSGVIEGIEQQTKVWRHHFSREKKLSDILKFGQKNRIIIYQNMQWQNLLLLLKLVRHWFRTKPWKKFFFPMDSEFSQFIATGSCGDISRFIYCKFKGIRWSHTD